MLKYLLLFTRVILLLCTAFLSIQDISRAHNNKYPCPTPAHSIRHRREVIEIFAISTGSDIEHEHNVMNRIQGAC